MTRKERPTVARLRAFLAYDKASGVLTWKRDKGPCKAAAVAGSLTGKGYMHVGFDGTYYGLHVLAFVIVTGRWPRADIDHIDGDRTNNRWANLREATRAQNGRNRQGANANNLSTGVRGVYPARNGKFQAYLTLHVGTFNTIPAASRAIEKVRALHHGAFANKGALSHGR